MSEKQRSQGRTEQPAQGSIQRSQETLQNAFAFPMNQVVNLQKAAAELARNGIQMASWAQSRNIDVTKETLDSYIQLLEQTTRGTEEMARQGIETLERTTGAGQADVQGAQRQISPAERAPQPGGQSTAAEPQYRQPLQSHPPQQSPPASQQPHSPPPQQYQEPQRFEEYPSRQFQAPQPPMQPEESQTQQPHQYPRPRTPGSQPEPFGAEPVQQYSQPGQPPAWEPEPEPARPQTRGEPTPTRQPVEEFQEASPEPPTQ